MAARGRRRGPQDEAVGRPAAGRPGASGGQPGESSDPRLGQTADGRQGQFMPPQPNHEAEGPAPEEEWVARYERYKAFALDDPEPPEFLRLLIAAMLVVAAAAIVWHWIETPGTWQNFD